MVSAGSPSGLPAQAHWPFSLRVDELACMLNFELADHPVYDGAELQWFDDAEHGVGMLAFLSRRDGRRVDYYAQHGLHLDPSGYELGGGTGTWNDIDFDVARLVVADDGVEAAARFTDIDGRLIEISVTDRDGQPRRPGGLLAPVGAGVEHPTSLLLVWMPRFDLVRAAKTPPSIRIDGTDTSTGRLPGMRLHRRHLIKYAAPVITVELNRCSDRESPAATTAAQFEVDADDRLRAVNGEHAGHLARLRLDPPFPSLSSVTDGARSTGRWHVEADAVRLTGGTWSVARTGDRTEIALDVDEQWKPGRLPWLMRAVTTLVPVFRRWPTTYRWRATAPSAAQSTVTGRWERTTSDRGRSYLRVTRSA